MVQVSPKGDLVFVKCSPEEVKSLGGILLPSSAARKPTSGTVVSLGDGRVGQKDDYQFTLKKGDSVDIYVSLSTNDCSSCRFSIASLGLLIQS